MKKAIVLLFTCIASFAYPQATKSITNAEIKEVKVFLNGAQVTRIVHTTVDAGTTQLSVEGLSEYLNGGSITVTGTGDATLLSVVSQLDYINDTKKSPRLRALQDSLNELNHSMDKLNDLAAIYN